MPHYTLRRRFFKRHSSRDIVSPDQIIPLSELASGEEAVFVDLHGGLGIRSRLTSLGFTPGVPLLMVQNYGWGSVIVELRGTRLALGRHEARKILVERRKS